MKHCKSVLSLLILVLAFACAATAQDGPDVTFKFKNVVVPKTEQTSIFGINNSGAMVGYYIDKTGTSHGLLLVNGEVTNIDDPEALCCTEPNNVNSSGTIVGQYQTFYEGNETTFSFSYQNGQFTDVGPTGCIINSAADGINDNGVIVGNCTDSSGVGHGYLLNAGVYTFLDYPGANNFTAAYGINNAGLVTLQWTDSDGNAESATYNSVTQEYSAPINVPGAVQTYAHSINNAGDIDFSWADASGNLYGALLTTSGDCTNYCTFSDPHGPDDTRADGINDSLDIVGRWEKTGGEWRGFEATIKKGKGGVALTPCNGNCAETLATSSRGSAAKSTRSVNGPKSPMLWSGK